MKAIIKISNASLYVIYAIVAVVVVIAAPIALGFKPVIVQSQSMKQSYPVGTIIYYKEADFNSIEKGDVITFKISEDGELVTHRVFKKNEDTKSFITKGDNNSSTDPVPIPYGNVVGKVAKKSIPKLGFFIDKIKRLPAIIFMVCLVLINILLHYGFDDEINNKSINKNEMGKANES